MKTLKKLFKSIKSKPIFSSIAGVFLLLTASCTNKVQTKTVALNNEPLNIEKSIPQNNPLPPEFNDYWYTGEAEISSYTLEQARYGELRKGQAVLIYVTEDFLPEIQVKADNRHKNNISVLKLNATKTFNTGIYPYSIMQSTFYPVTNNKHALKVSSSMQEWCGHTYVQLNNREQYEVTLHSYFEGEADKKLVIDKSILENELWTQLRLNPKSLPIGDLKIIPALEFIRLKHVPIKAYPAKAVLKNDMYHITYPSLNRTLTITFNPEFPYDILGWEESYKSGFGSNSKVLTTRASKLKSIKTPYWNKNRNSDEVLRETLMLN
ncbi:septum formation inhibitor Maf [Cognatitamlana onchidii]|uniref:septum formation inhibitor Maf n=1 Tax=Cognatitamlana onchidii TaxID=2562860 RepID=UPI0010A608B5|nr:septum formation inhibitor Maf [Algibacter onchidii]